MKKLDCGQESVPVLSEEELEVLDKKAVEVGFSNSQYFIFSYFSSTTSLCFCIV